MPGKSFAKKAFGWLCRWWGYLAVGGSAAAMLWAALLYADAINSTDPLPLAGQKRVAQLTEEFEKYQKKNERRFDQTQRAIIGTGLDACRWAYEMAESDLRKNQRDADAKERKKNASACIDKQVEQLTKPLPEE